MKPRHTLAASLFYAQQGLVSVALPFLPILFSQSLGFTPSQIGLLSALRPWVSAPCGSIAAALADRLSAHRTVLLVCYIAAVAAQGAMALVVSFPAQLALTLAVSTVWTGPSIIGDAAVMAAATHPGDYGRVRTWASVAWAALAPVAGVVNERLGLRAGIAVYCVGSVLTAPAGWALPLEALSRRRRRRAAAAAGRETLLEEPLLSGEVPETPFSALCPPTPALSGVAAEEGRAGGRPAALARALAIVRYIEAVTEIGAVPPPASLYGFAEVATPYASGHFKSELGLGNGGGGGSGGTGEAAGFAPATDEERLAMLEDGEGGITTETPAEAHIAPDEEPQAAGERGEGLPVPHTSPEPSTPSSLSKDFVVEGEQPSPHVHESSSAPSLPGLRLKVQPPPPGEGLLRGHLTASRSAGDLLRSVRDIQAYRPGPSEATQASGLPPLPPGRPPGRRAHKEETLRWLSDVTAGGHGDMPPPDEEGVFFEDQDVQSPPPSRPPPAGAHHRLLEGESEEDEGPVRLSAMQRLTQIFTRRGESPSSGGLGADDTGTPRTPYSSLTGTPAAHSLLSGFTPVRTYLESRRMRLARVGAAATATAGDAEAHPPEPGTGYLEGAFPGVHEHPHGLATEPSLGAPLVLPAGVTVAADWAAAGVSPELMAEALELEAAEIAEMSGATGALVVDTLAKKLARMAAAAAAEERRERRRRRRRSESHQMLGVEPPRTEQPKPRQRRPPVSPSGEATSPAPSDIGDIGPLPAVLPRLAALARTPGVIPFFFLATLLGFGHGIVGCFLFLYLAQLGAGEGIMGYILLANALPEMPVFWFFGSILRVIGMDTLLLASAAALGLRLAAYSLFGAGVIALHWILALETIHALTYACGWSACAINASKIAPPGLESTTQAIFQGLWTGVGAGAGGLVGGALYHWHGPEAVFLGSGAVILVGTAVAGVALAAKHHTARAARSEVF